MEGKTIPAEILVIRHGHVADYQGDVGLLPEGRLAAFNAGFHLADRVADAQHPADRVVVTVLSSPAARARETAEELARGLITGLLVQNKTRARVLPPRQEAALRNFQFIIDGRQVLPTDAMHPSLPAWAEHNPFFQAFWQAEQDPIGYWMNHPSESAETPASVAARLHALLVSLLDAASPGFFVLVTHSAPIRAFLRVALGADPGEPDFCEAFQVDASGVRYHGQHAKIPNYHAH